MAENPIKYQDLISPDDSIITLIGQLTRLDEVYGSVADSIKANAAGVASSLKSVSGATMAGQQATRQYSAEADKLAKAYRDLSFARSDTARKIQELKVAQAEENRITKLQILLNNSAEGSYAHLSAQYSLNKMALNQMTKAERENEHIGKKLEEQTKAIYEEMNRLQQATGKYSLNVGNYEQSITNAIGINTRWYNGLQQITTMFEGGLSNGLKIAGEAVVSFGRKLLALLANPIVATIAAITAAFMALAKGISTSEENTMALERVLAPFQRVLTGVISILQNAATRVLRFAEGFEMAAMAVSKFLERIPLIGDYIKTANDAIRDNVDLTKAQQELVKKERANLTERAKLERDVAKARNEAERTNDPKKRVALLKQADAAERKILANELALAKEDLRIKTAKAAQAKNDKKVNDELAQAQQRLYKAEEQYYQRTTRLQSKIRTNENKINAGGGGRNEAADKALEERRKIEDARIALIEDSEDRERQTIIVSYNRKIEDAKNQYGAETELAVLYEQEKQQKLADLLEKGAQQQRDREKKDYDARIKALDDAEKRRQAVVKASEKAIEETYELEVSESELEDNENRKTDMRLKAEKKRLEALLKLYEQDGRILTDKEIQTLKNSISAVDKELEENTKEKSIWDVFGLSDKQKDAMNEALNYAMDNLNQLMDAYTEAAERKRELADAEVERAKSVLDAEIEARNNGYANDVETARKELELAKKNQQKAIEQQQRAQRAQQAIQTVEQATNLITATSLIFKQFGNPLVSIPMVALMWGSFLAAKIKAAQVTKMGSESYGEGTVELLQGGSHQSGRDIDLGRKPDGTRRRAEGGEYFAVVNKRSSRKFRNVIPDVMHSLNDGTFAEKYMTAYNGDVNIVDTKAPDISVLTSDVRRIREQGENSRYTTPDGQTIIIYKNLRRRVRR